MVSAGTDSKTNDTAPDSVTVPAADIPRLLVGSYTEGYIYDPDRLSPEDDVDVYRFSLGADDTFFFQVLSFYDGDPDLHIDSPEFRVRVKVYNASNLSKTINDFVTVWDGDHGGFGYPIGPLEPRDYVISIEAATIQTRHIGPYAVVLYREGDTVPVAPPKFCEMGTEFEDRFSASAIGECFDGLAGNDEVSYSASTAGVSVWLNSGEGDGGFAESDRYKSIEDVSGSRFSDSLFGNGKSNSLYGGGGHDTLVGGNGNDELRGQWGNDDLRGDGGNDSLYGGRGNNTLDGGRDNDFLVGDFDDDLLIGGSGDDSLYGENGDDTLDGGDGKDTLLGNSGDDTINGGDDKDTLQGRAGDDSLAGGAGADALHGGADIDWADYSASPASVRVNLETGAGHGGDAAGDTLKSIENLIGSDGDDMLIGDGISNALKGRGGTDQLSGRGGDDALQGGSNSDVLRGGGGSDVLLGGSGFDTLRGGAGEDTLDGGSGNDVLYGGADADWFIFSPGGRRDRIFDLDTSQDQLDLRDFNLANAGQVRQLASDVGNGVLIDFGGKDDLIVEGIVVADLTGALLVL